MTDETTVVTDDTTPTERYHRDKIAKHQALLETEIKRKKILPLSTEILELVSKNDGEMFKEMVGEILPKMARAKQKMICDYYGLPLPEKASKKAESASETSA